MQVNIESKAKNSEFSLAEVASDFITFLGGHENGYLSVSVKEHDDGVFEFKFSSEFDPNLDAVYINYKHEDKKEICFICRYYEFDLNEAAYKKYRKNVFKAALDCIESVCRAGSLKKRIKKDCSLCQGEEKE